MILQITAKPHQLFFCCFVYQNELFDIYKPQNVENGV